MSAAGGILLELLPPTCDSFGVLRLDQCLNFFHWEEFLEFAGVWLALVALLGQLSDAVPMPNRRVRRVLYALPAIWILLLFLNSLIPRLELRLFAQPAIVKFESGVYLRGYRIGNGAGASSLRLYASARRWKYMGLGYSVHLVDQSAATLSPAMTSGRIISLVSGCWLQTIHLFSDTIWSSESRRMRPPTARYGLF